MVAPRIALGLILQCRVLVADPGLRRAHRDRQSRATSDGIAASDTV
jgi:hypothetical protein